jgi:carbonic anhydrase
MTAATEAEAPVTDDEDDDTPPSKSGIDAYLPTRRDAFYLLGGTLIGGLVGYEAAGVTAEKAAVAPDRNDAAVLTYKQARAVLEEGNARYVAGRPLRPDQTVGRRSALAAGQHPFAAVLSCADSRVAPEVLFDQGLGDLFVVRSAGQVIDRAVLGSLQYGVEHLGPPLLVVLGHSACGAVKATLEAVTTKAKASGTAIDDLVAAIKPSIIEAEEIGTDEKAMLDVAIALNVERVVDSLKEDHVVGEAVAKRKLKVVGAVYDLATGSLDWL